MTAPSAPIARMQHHALHRERRRLRGLPQIARPRWQALLAGQVPTRAALRTLDRRVS